MPSPLSPALRRRRVRGFSLVEVMLGILLGMFAVIAVLKVFSQSDTAQRIGNASGEAQVNAAMALDLLSRDVRQAGQSLNSLNLLGCALSIGTTTQTFVVAPVVINDTDRVPAGDAHTDTLLVMSGDYGGSPEGDAVSATGTGTVTVTTASAFAAGDALVLGPISPTAQAGTECTLPCRR
jgi:type IV pilus assembly protein PilW